MTRPDRPCGRAARARAGSNSRRLEAFRRGQVGEPCLGGRTACPGAVGRAAFPGQARRSPPAHARVLLGGNDQTSRRSPEKRVGSPRRQSGSCAGGPAQVLPTRSPPLAAQWQRSGWYCEHGAAAAAREKAAAQRSERRCAACAIVAALRRPRNRWPPPRLCGNPAWPGSDAGPGRSPLNRNGSTPPGRVGGLGVAVDVFPPMPPGSCRSGNCTRGHGAGSRGRFSRCSVLAYRPLAVLTAGVSYCVSYYVKISVDSTHRYLDLAMHVHTAVSLHIRNYINEHIFGSISV